MLEAVPGVFAVDAVRCRRAGPSIAVDAHVSVRLCLAGWRAVTAAWSGAGDLSAPNRAAGIAFVRNTPPRGCVRSSAWDAHAPPAATAAARAALNQSLPKAMALGLLWF